MIDAITERVEEIFYDTLAIKPADRKSHLDRVCAGDADLRLKVEGMLSQQAKVDEFFRKENPGNGVAQLAEEASARVAANPNLIASPDEELGKLIGPYKLLQKIGEGGCGVVYMAAQEKPVRRRVALKVIKL